MNFTHLRSDSQLVAHLSILAGECDINKEFLGPEPIKHRRNVCRVVVPFQAILSLVLHCQSEVFSETKILIITILGGKYIYRATTEQHSTGHSQGSHNQLRAG